MIYNPYKDGFNLPGIDFNLFVLLILKVNSCSSTIAPIPISSKIKAENNEEKAYVFSQYR